MKWAKDNKGGMAMVVAALVLGILMGLFVYRGGYYAEAVLGGVGNLTDTDNVHNLSVNATHGGIQAVEETQICIFCHTPHGAIKNAALINGPLWNHKLSNVASYILKTPTGSWVYNSELGTGGGNYVQHATPSQPDGASKMCLSCHDGTIAIGAVASRSSIIWMSGACLNAAGALSDTCKGLIGTNLTGHHVVSVPMNQSLIENATAACTNGSGATTMLRYPWNASVEARENILLRPTNAEFPPGNKGVSGDVPTGAGATKYSSGYRYGVQCSTCHDPHLWWTKTGCSSCNFLVNGACANDWAAEGCGSNLDPLCTACHIDC